MRTLIVAVFLAGWARADFFDEPARKQLLELGGKLKAAQADAVAFLFDDGRYPVPAQAHAGWRVGIDRQPGHKEMEKRVGKAIRLHNLWIERVAAGLKIKTRTVGLKRPTTEPLEVTRPVNHYGILVIDVGVERFLKKDRQGALGALARKEWKAALAQGAKLEGLDALVWETLRAAVVLSWNERHGARHDTNEMEGMRILNAYRVCLGLPPLALDQKLHHMAQDFALEMKRGRFFSHQHPHDPSRRTLGRRASRVHYKGGVGENVSSEGDAKKAVWRWRADAGHHRLMVKRLWRAAGLGCSNRSVLNTGTASSLEILALYGAGKN